MLLDFIMMRYCIRDRRRGRVLPTSQQEKLAATQQNKLAEGPRPPRELHKLTGKPIDWQRPATADPEQPGYFARQGALPQINYTALILRCQLIPGKNTRYHTAYVLAHHLVHLDGAFIPIHFIEQCMQGPDAAKIGRTD